LLAVEIREVQLQLSVSYGNTLSNAWIRQVFKLLSCQSLNLWQRATRLDQ